MTPAELLLPEEGGLANVPGDRGGLTGLGGQTAGWLEGVLGHPVDDAYLRALTPAIAAENIGLWLAQHGLDRLLLGGQLDALAAAVIDYAYQSGEGRAIPALQRLLGFTTTVAHIGPATLDALQPLRGEDRDRIADRVHADRIAFEGRIMERDWEVAVATVHKTLKDHGVDESVTAPVNARLNAMQAKFAAGWLARIAGLLARDWES